MEREVGAAEWLDKAAAFPAATLKLTEARQYTAAAQAQDERYWIRSEAEADMFWPVRCPGVPPGPCAQVDIGAGTTNAATCCDSRDAALVSTGAGPDAVPGSRPYLARRRPLRG